MQNLLFIIDKTADISTQARDYGTMTAIKGVTPTTVDYSGYLYNNKGADLTLEQYRALKQNPNLITVTADEFYEIRKKFEKSLEGEFTEETEEQYYDALECLPPCKWHDLDDRFNTFYISEGITGSLHSFHIKDRKTGKYYTALRSMFIKDNDLLNDIKTKTQ